MKLRIVLMMVIMTLVVGGCQKKQSFTDAEIQAMVEENSTLQMEIASLEKDVSRLEEDIEELQSEKKGLEGQMAKHGMQLDQLEFLKTNVLSLQTALNNFSDKLPIVDDQSNPYKKKILEEINFKNHNIDLKDDEMMLFATILHDVDVSTKEALIECSVYKKITDGNDQEIDYIRVMFINVEKLNNKWKVIKFSRTN